MTIIEHLMQVTTSGLLDATRQLVANVMEWLGPIFQSLVVIYLAVWGYLLWTGITEEPLKDSILKFLRISVVAAFALGLGFYSVHVMQIAWHGPQEIINAVTGGSADSAVAILGNVWKHMTAQANEAMEEGAWWDVGAQLRGLMIAGMLITATFIFCAPIFVIILASKLLLAIMLVVGPIFIAMALFKRGVQFTQQWIAQVFNYFMIYVLALVLMALASALFSDLLTNALKEAPPSFLVAMQVLMVSIVFCYASIWIPTIAGALAGSMSAPVEGAVGKITAGLKGGGQNANGVAKRQGQNMRSFFRKEGSQRRAAQERAGPGRRATRAMWQTMRSRRGSVGQN